MINIVYIISCSYDINYDSPELDVNNLSVKYIDSDFNGVKNILYVSYEIKNNSGIGIYKYDTVVIVEFRDFSKYRKSTSYEIPKKFEYEFDIGAHDVVDINIGAVAERWENMP